jgi:hypothetical protein
MAGLSSVEGAIGLGESNRDTSDKTNAERLVRTARVCLNREGHEGHEGKKLG